MLPRREPVDVEAAVARSELSRRVADVDTDPLDGRPRRPREVEGTHHLGFAHVQLRRAGVSVVAYFAFGLGVALAAGLAIECLTSTTITSNGVSPTFSGR